jgi:hypothetical protein
MRYAFTFPLFFFLMLPMILYVPFDKRGWPHIDHTRDIDLGEVKASAKGKRD